MDVGGVEFGGPDLSSSRVPARSRATSRLSGSPSRSRPAAPRLLRGGAFKPRTSPYSFQGLGNRRPRDPGPGRDETRSAAVTEALDIDVLDQVAEYADMVQIGARNMQNYTLLKRVGRCGRPCCSSEACRDADRAVPGRRVHSRSGQRPGRPLRARDSDLHGSHPQHAGRILHSRGQSASLILPIIADPSHAAGKRDTVLSLSRAAVAVGADGLMIEVHDKPERGLSDGLSGASAQSSSTQLMAEVRVVAAVHRSPGPSPVGIDGHL